MNAAQAAALSSELDQLEMATLAALSGQGPATAGVLNSGEVPTSALDAAAASGAGVSSGGIGDLRLGGGGGAIRPGQAGGGLGSLGQTGKSGGTGGTGEVKKVAGPRARLRRWCCSERWNREQRGTWSRACARDSALATIAACRRTHAQGSIRLSIRSALVARSPEFPLPERQPSRIGRQLRQARASAAQFAPPGGSAVIVVPVTFVKQ
jgi:hypothetical protein